VSWLNVSFQPQMIKEFLKKQSYLSVVQSHCMQGTDTYFSTAELLLRLYYSGIILALPLEQYR